MKKISLYWKRYPLVITVIGIPIAAFIVCATIQPHKNKLNVQPDMEIFKLSEPAGAYKANSDELDLSEINSTFEELIDADIIKAKFIDLPETNLNSGLSFNEDTQSFVINCKELVRFTEDTATLIFIDEFENQAIDTTYKEFKEWMRKNYNLTIN